ncbi:MAG: aldo/keto reductase [Nitrospinae bacterium]|nr:aldo/keto reductase [Nitrospinota bacterium]
MTIAGRATPEGTERYKKRMAGTCSEGRFRQAEGLYWSSVGMGTYLGAADAATDEMVTEAAVNSVCGGINVLDTAVNYRRQRAERSVGEALRRLLDSGKAERAEIVLCTKGGFLPHPDGPRWFQREYVDSGKGGATLDDLADDCHCMHPDYLADQLDRSRANLGVETIDLYYVHNPETQLEAVGPDVFYARLEAAFGALERAADDGKIQYYGMATWSAFRVAPGSARSVSLERARIAAQGAAADGKGALSRRRDRFRFIQLPFNLNMPEAMTSLTQSAGGTLKAAIPAAGELGLHPVLSASFAQGRIGGLDAGLAKLLGAGLKSDAQRALQFARGAPGALVALIGMKDPGHVEENLALCQTPILDRQVYGEILRRLEG